MFRKLSKKNRKKMLLNTFVYYPLGLAIAVLVTITLIKFVSKGGPTLGFMVVFIIFGIFTGVMQVLQIYKKLLREDNHKKGVE